MAGAFPALPLETNTSTPNGGSRAVKNSFDPAQVMPKGSIPGSRIWVPSSVPFVLQRERPLMPSVAPNQATPFRTANPAGDDGYVGEAETTRLAEDSMRPCAAG